jgi:hypothetical protein
VIGSLTNDKQDTSNRLEDDNAGDPWSQQEGSISMFKRESGHRVRLRVRAASCGETQRNACSYGVQKRSPAQRETADTTRGAKPHPDLVMKIKTQGLVRSHLSIESKWRALRLRSSWDTSDS